MHITLLGATGRTGSEFMRQAWTAGHDITAYVRRPGALEPRDRLTIVGGQLDDFEAMDRAMMETSAVVVTLGPKISEPNAPIMQTAVPNVIAAAQRSAIQRVVVLSALGVGRTFANTRYPYRLGCRTFLAGNFRDHEAGESQLEDSGLRWTTVHPGPLSDGARTAHPLIVDAATGYMMPRAPRTSRADVAAAMLAMLDEPDTVGKQMLITSATQTDRP